MAMTKERLEYQREYRKRTGNAAQKKYYEGNKEKIQEQIDQKISPVSEKKLPWAPESPEANTAPPAPV